MGHCMSVGQSDGMPSANERVVADTFAAAARLSLPPTVVAEGE